MKRYIRTGILALSLSALPVGLSAMAQTSGYQEGQGYQDRTGTTTQTETGGRDWGWLGLLGLLGLAGLMGRREESARHRSTDYRTGETLGSR